MNTNIIFLKTLIFIGYRKQSFEMIFFFLKKKTICNDFFIILGMYELLRLNLENYIETELPCNIFKRMQIFMTFFYEF